ncbi:hypothetical protein ONZ45_g9617 [Pleurotus djamor]|nr:hypothetical protein ONZ45_g9617 [Pleurotus djamor]
MPTTPSQTDSSTAPSNKRKRTDDNNDASKSEENSSLLLCPNNLPSALGAIEDNQQPSSGDLESKMWLAPKGDHIKPIRGVVMNQFHFTFLYVKALDGPSKPENCERYLSIPNRLTIEDMSKMESIYKNALEFVVSAMTYLALHSHDEIANDPFFEITSDSYQCSD